MNICIFSMYLIVLLFDFNQFLKSFAKGFITFIYKLYVVIEMLLHLLYA